MAYTYDRIAKKMYRTKEDALNAGIKDVKEQIVEQKRMIKEMTSIASGLGAKAVALYVKKEKAHLANRESLLRELELELKNDPKPSAEIWR